MAVFALTCETWAIHASQSSRQAACILKPGGTLVYSTCSLEPEENGKVVDEFLREQADFKLERTRELLPFVEGVDGTYVARITRMS